MKTDEQEERLALALAEIFHALACMAGVLNNAPDPAAVSQTIRKEVEEGMARWIERNPFQAEQGGPVVRELMRATLTRILGEIERPL